MYIYPTLLCAANIINSYSWFNIKQRKNSSSKKKKKKRKIRIDYIDTTKIVLYPTNEQKNIIKQWMDDCIDIYNSTNEYIKKNINDTNKRKLLNFIDLRKSMNDKILNICKTNNLNKHTGDYAVKHCVEMYKSALSNIKSLNFNIKNLEKNRRRKNLIIEPASVSSKHNSIFFKQLNKIDSNINLNIIKKNSVLQYDSYLKSYCIIVPKEQQKDRKVEQYKKCAIDIGVRTFATVYSRVETLEIGSNTYPYIDKYNNKLDCINKNKNLLTESKYNTLNNRYYGKLKNLITDLHNKTSNYLLSKYRTVLIGKVSTKKMVSNETSNLSDNTKRRLMALSHYRFRMKLKSMASKFGSKIKEISEYKTSITCCRCGNEHKTLGANKIYICAKCKLEIDRDINAAINIYKNN